MKKSTFTVAVLLFAAIQTMFSANITISIVGLTYSPAAVNAAIGDVVTIAASVNHPLVQVSQADWNTSTPTPVGGWTNQTSAYTFTVTTSGTFYYGCSVHMPSGMKGFVTMSPAGMQQVTANAHSISLYPNPVTNGEFTVKAEGYAGDQTKVMIYNENGQALEAYDLKSSATFVKTKLPSGSYFYTVMVGTQAVNRGKFVVTQSK